MEVLETGPMLVKAGSLSEPGSTEGVALVARSVDPTPLVSELGFVGVFCVVISAGLLLKDVTPVTVKSLSEVVGLALEKVLATKDDAVFEEIIVFSVLLVV